MPIYNNIRDAVIFIMFIRCLIKKELKFGEIDYVWILFFFIWFYGFFLTFLFGYPIIGISGIHLFVVPALLYLVISNSNESFNYKEIEFAFIRVALVIASLGLISYIFKPYYFKKLFAISGNVIDASDYIRLVSVFLSPNICGCYFAIAFSLALSMFVRTRKNIYLLPMIVFLLCIFLTLSRGSWCFVVAALILSFFFFNLKNFLGLIAVCLLCLSCSLFITDFSFNQKVSMSEHGTKRLVTLFDSKNGSSYGRMNDWGDIFREVSTQATGFGIGVGSTAQIGYGNLANIRVVDGNWMRFFIETGFIGLLYSFLFVGWAFGKVYTFLKVHDSTLGVFPLFICFGFFLQSVGSTPFDFVPTAPFFWIFFGLASKKVKEKKLIFN